MSYLLPYFPDRLQSKNRFRCFFCTTYIVWSNSLNIYSAFKVNKKIKNIEFSTITFVLHPKEWPKTSHTYHRISQSRLSLVHLHNCREPYPRKGVKEWIHVLYVIICNPTNQSSPSKIYTCTEDINVMARNSTSF